MAFKNYTKVQHLNDYHRCALDQPPRYALLAVAILLFSVILQF